MTTLSPADINIGDRDRDDLGDIAGLAKSISEVGLLHPIVVTADHSLVAGGRRLAAVKSLGWTQVAVTEVDLSTAAKALQAEADENTCRKPLTPYEASRARQRRAEVLAPKAAQQMRAAQPLSKLDKAPLHVRKAASVGTGYSGSTLDKVDRIRDAAERGIVRQGKKEIAAPAPVVEVAKRVLSAVKETGAAVDRSSRDFEASVEAYVATDPSVQRARLMKVFTAKQGAMVDISSFDVDSVFDAMADDDLDIFLTLKRGLDRWTERLVALQNRPLRAVPGGKK